MQPTAFLDRLLPHNATGLFFSTPLLPVAVGQLFDFHTVGAVAILAMKEFANNQPSHSNQCRDWAPVLAKSFICKSKDGRSTNMDVPNICGFNYLNVPPSILNHRPGQTDNLRSTTETANYRMVF